MSVSENELGAPRRQSIFLGPRTTTVWNRLLAKSIDGVILLTVYLIGNAFLYPSGVFAAAFLSLILDGWGVGQSIGKRVIGLQVVEEPSGSPCGLGDSAVRNLPFALGIVLGSFRFFWVFALIGLVPWLVLELYLIFALDSGVRLGDVLANTLVQDYGEDLALNVELID